MSNGESLTPETLRFSWVMGKSLAASARPGRYGPLNDHLQFLVKMGIRTIINLCEDALFIPDAYDGVFKIVHVAVIDGDVPSTVQMEDIFRTVGEALNGGGPCLVHCRGGIGRTATVLAPLLMRYKNMSFDETTAFLRLSGRRTETMEQYRFIQKWDGEDREF